MRRRAAIAVRLAVACLLTALVVPGSGVRPAAISLYAVETAKGVDFSDGVVWVLVLGSDAGFGQPLKDGRTDAIQLVGIDGRSGSAVGLGVPRDAWLDMPGVGLDRINAAYGHEKGGAHVVSSVVADLVGITPDLVLVVGFDGFVDLVGTLGRVEVRTPEAFETDQVRVREGLNRFGASEALAYVRQRKALARYDFARSRNQQRLMLGALRRLRESEDDEGFMERAALAAIGSVETDLTPLELYRFAQFLTTVDPRRVETCVLPGTPAMVGDLSVVDLDERAASLIGRDAEDLRLQRGCRPSGASAP